MRWKSSQGSRVACSMPGLAAMSPRLAPPAWTMSVPQLPSMELTLHRCSHSTKAGLNPAGRRWCQASAACAGHLRHARLLLLIPVLVVHFVSSAWVTLPLPPLQTLPPGRPAEVLSLGQERLLHMHPGRGKVVLKVAPGHRGPRSQGWDGVACCSPRS